MQHEHAAGHSHGAGAHLPAGARGALSAGLRRLLDVSTAMSFKPLASEEYPLPLAQAAYSAAPAPETVRRDIVARIEADPASVLEYALVLLELYELNQPDIGRYILDDMPFIRACFSSKRCNGWRSVVWVSPKVAEIMGAALPPGVAIG